MWAEIVRGVGIEAEEAMKLVGVRVVIELPPAQTALQAEGPETRRRSAQVERGHVACDIGKPVAKVLRATRDGIYDYVSHDDLIVRNRIHEVRYGVHQMYAKNETLQDNISFGNVAGLALMSSDHLRVWGNRIYDDSSYGILFNYVTYSDISGNEVRGITGQTGQGGAVLLGSEPWK